MSSQEHIRCNDIRMETGVWFGFLLVLLGLSPAYSNIGTQSAEESAPAQLKVQYTFDLGDNCTVEPVDSTIQDQLRSLVSGGANLIQITLSFVNHSSPPEDVSSTVFKLFHWDRTIGREGRGLLLLEKGFQTLSFTTLSHGVIQLNIELMENPWNCLLMQSVNDIEKALRVLLLNDFKSSSAGGNSGSLGENEHICNLHIRDRDGTAKFIHMCCQMDSTDVVCEELVEDIWITILFISVYILNVLIIMYVPNLIPQVLYRNKSKDLKYEIILKKPITATVKKEFITKQSLKGKNVISLGKFNEKTTPQFRKLLDKMKNDVVYTLTISKLEILIRLARLLPPNYVPVGIIRAIYDSIFRCKIREKEAVRDCCAGNLFGRVRPFGKEYAWFRCLQQFMWCVLVLVASIPWIIRLYVYYAEEEEQVIAREQAAYARGLDAPYPGTLVEYLSPVHGLFIACYALLLFDGLVLSFVSKDVAEKFKFILRKCFRDMKEVSRARAIGWGAKVILMPIKGCGIFAFLFMWIYWVLVLPIVIVVLLFYFFPTLNVLGRLFVHFFAYCVPYGKAVCSILKGSRLVKILKEDLGFGILMKDETLRRPESVSMRFRLFQLLVINICMFSVVAFVILATECVIFYIEIVVYTMIGVIVNAAEMLKYVTLAIMLYFYAKSCFSSVHSKYLSFNEKLIAALAKKGEAEIAEISWLPEEKQSNNGFEIETGHEGDFEDEGETSLVVNNGVLRWNTHGVVLFMDKRDKLHTTKKFFFQTAYMNHVGCPGKLYANLFSALSQLMVIIVFLLFVLLIVQAFGETYEVSGTNQLLATLAGGFLPWILRFVLFKDPPAIAVNTDSLHFQNLLNRKILNYWQTWRTFDISVDKYEILNQKKTEDGKSENPVQSDDIDVGADISKETIRSSTLTQNSDSIQVENHEMELIVPSLEKEFEPVQERDKVDLIINTANDIVSYAVHDV